MSNQAIAQIDHDFPDVDTDVTGSGITVHDIDPEAALAKFEAAVKLQNRMTEASLKATRPQDWVVMGGKAYLQGTGAERVASLFGIVLGKPEITKETHADGSYSYEVVGPVMCRSTGAALGAVYGGRSSADKFFGSNPDPLDVKKAAVTNWQCRAVSMLAGLRGLTAADLDRAGLGGVTTVEYATGAKGGATAPAELKTEQVKLGNEILKRTGGDKDVARTLLKELTHGKDFAGFESVDRMKQPFQFEQAWKRLRAHAVFGDNATPREPGQEG